MDTNDMPIIRGLPDRFEKMLSERAHAACFTGHRTISSAAEPALRRDTAEVIRTLYKAGYTLFLTGGALGFDTLALETLLALKATCPDLSALMIIPCANQSALWPAAARERYLNLVQAADGCICLQRDYSPDCMHRRNRFMVDHSSLCIAYYDGRRSGGTGATVRYAMRNGVTVHHLHPSTHAKEFSDTKETLSLFSETSPNTYNNLEV